MGRHLLPQWSPEKIVPRLMEQHTRMSAHLQTLFDIFQKVTYLVSAFIRYVKGATTEVKFFSKMGDNNTIPIKRMSSFLVESGR